MPASRVTMQHIVPVGGRVPVPEWDVAADWSGPLAPPSILLDFAYGIAVIKRWATDDLQGMLNDRHDERFTGIPLIIRSDPAEEGEGEGDIEPNDDPSDGDYRRHRIRSEESEFSRVMDDAFYLAMIFRPAPPGAPTAGEIQEERSRQEGREKVQGWLEASEPSLLFYWV
ncbi:hypothetical protein BC826DRAFT_741909 [Russula brevipes]|nr:hypothetical protein BC826DRAFT_741909 [Russula brevipes]